MLEISGVRQTVICKTVPLHVEKPAEIDFTQRAGTTFEISAIRVVLFESLGRLLPFSHPLWWTGIFAFVVREYIIDERPIYRFADPLCALAFVPERLKGIELMPPPFMKYTLSSLEPAQCRITPRLFAEENALPEGSYAMVVMDGMRQDILYG